MNGTIPASILAVLALASPWTGDGHGAPGAGDRILAQHFPGTAARASFFEERINAEDSSVRARVLVEVGAFHSLPDSEYVAFLRRMTQDTDPLVRGRAIKELYDLWVPQDPQGLPPVFAGYHDGQLVDRSSPRTVPALLAQCGQGGAPAGYAAYVLGLLRAEEAIPALSELGDDGNLFARFTAARALLDCGDRSSAVALFERLSARQLALYASENTTEEGAAPAHLALPAGDGSERSAYYAAAACRGLVECGGEQRREGLRRLVELMGHLQRSGDPNDRNALHEVRAMLAGLSGEYFITSAEASAWMARAHPQREQRSDG